MKKLKKVTNADEIKKEKLYTGETFCMDFFILFFLFAFFSPFLLIIAILLCK